ncbi:MAG: putative zinc-binding metallopeptidase [Prevotellaceae bacterium]|jgi:substrate import-associated zinc metallohydrolase lipoprotein|nr:putative zinc-binding metallopeptidase [Prevotellaceae bacterium]
MIRKLIIFFTVIGVTCFFSTCAKEDEMGSSIFDTTPAIRTELDQWIYQNLTIPYNLEITYKWKYTESELTRNLTPPKELQAEGFIKNLITEGWINPYTKIAGLNFFNKYSPKQIFLVGTTAYNSTGTITLGTAQAGRKVVIYEVNQFDTKNKDRLRRYMKTIHHEFTHIVNQKVNYDVEFELVTSGGYRSDWNNATEAWCRENGFITPYSSASPTEDFAEMTAMMLTNSASEWRNLIDVNPSSAQAVALLQKKEELVVQYFKNNWGFDMYDLQAEMENAIIKITNQ